MPLYEYECDACGHRFEKIQKFSDPPIETCPKCGGAVHKMQSAPAFHLKGTGWYATDYAKKDQSPPAKSDSGSAAGKNSSTTSDKTEKSEKTEKVEKSDKPEKSAASGDTSKAPPAKDKSA